MSPTTRRLLIDLVIVEVVAIAVIAFAYYVWPYPPLVWKIDYAAFNGVTFITVMMAALAWMLVGYTAVSLFQVGLGLWKRISPRPPAVSPSSDGGDEADDVRPL